MNCSDGWVAGFAFTTNDAAGPWRDRRHRRMVERRARRRPAAPTRDRAVGPIGTAASIGRRMTALVDDCRREGSESPTPPIAPAPAGRWWLRPTSRRRACSRFPAGARRSPTGWSAARRPGSRARPATAPGRTAVWVVYTVPTAARREPGRLRGPAPAAGRPALRADVELAEERERPVGGDRGSTVEREDVLTGREGRAVRRETRD